MPNPDIGPRCPECRVGLGTHDERDPQCIDYRKARAVIPDEAVEAAAKWLHDIDCRSAIHSGHPADFECYGWLDEAREMLGIVAPHLMPEVAEDALRAAWDKGYATGQDGLAGRIAEAWDEGREHGIDECAGDVTGGIDPYRKPSL